MEIQTHTDKFVNNNRNFIVHTKSERENVARQVASHRLREQNDKATTTATPTIKKQTMK